MRRANIVEGFFIESDKIEGLFVEDRKARKFLRWDKQKKTSDKGEE